MKKDNEVKIKSSRSKKKVLATTIGTSLLSMSSAALGLSLYVGLNLTRRKRRPITDNPIHYGLYYEDVSFLSSDGETNLEGWFIHAKTEAKMTIILSHGYGGNRHHSGALELCYELSAHGYQVLMFDFRNSGESEGTITTIGAREKYDLLGAIEWAKTKSDKPIVLYGGSMGAATSILAGGLSKDAVAVIADSPFSDLKGYLKENLPVWSNLPAFPFTPLIMSAIPKIANLDIREASPITALESIYPRPVLFIHGDGDTKIPYTESQRMVALHPDKFDIWIPKGAEHVRGFRDYPEEYLDIIFQFLNKVEEEVVKAEDS